MQIIIHGQNVPMPDSTNTIAEILNTLSLLGYTSSEFDAIFINGDMITDRNLVVPEGATLEVKSAEVTVTKSVGSYFQEKKPYRAVSVRDFLTDAFRDKGFDFEINDETQVFDYSTNPPTIYTSSQLGETVKQGAMLNVMPWGKDTSGN